MPLPPLTVALTDGQKIEVMKRFRLKYGDELTKVETEMQAILTNMAEAEFLGQYLGEQPEVVELKKRKADLEQLERRRQLLGQIIERLDKYTPPQQAVTVAPPNPGGRTAPAGSGAAKQQQPPGIKRY